MASMFAKGLKVKQCDFDQTLSARLEHRVNIGGLVQLGMPKTCGVKKHFNGRQTENYTLACFLISTKSGRLLKLHCKII